MAHVNAKPDPMHNTSSQLEDLSNQIKTLSAELEDISRRSSIRTSSYASIKSSLTAALSAARSEAEKVRILANALMEITALYEQTEKRLVNAVSAEKTGIQEDANKIRDMLIEIGGLLGMDTASLFSGDPVNLSSGNYVYEKTFFHYDTPVSINLRIFYNVCGADSGALGRGWLHSFERRIASGDGTYRVLGEDGSVQIFRQDEQGGLAPAPGSFGKLRRTEDGFAYTDSENDTYHFGSDGRMTAAANADGWRVELRYEQDRLREAVSTDGVSLRFGYDGDGRLTEAVDQAGRAVHFQYTDGALARIEDMAGNATLYEYDEHGRLCRITAPTGDLSVQNTYDERNRTVQQLFADGGVVAYRYDDDDGAVVMRRQNGSEVTYYHDRQLRSTRTVYPDGEERIEYNAGNQRTAFTDKLGRVSRYAYDEAGRLSAFTNANGDTIAFAYNAAGQLKELTLDGQLLGSSVYDEKGHQSVHTDANGGECRFAYDALGRVTAVTHEDGSVTALEYDEHGNVASVQDPVTGCTRYEYDECRRVIATTDALGNETKYRYDALDQLLQVTNAEGRSRDYCYDARGNLVKVTDFNGGVTLIRYNAMNRPVSITDPDEKTTAFEYDTMSNPIRKTAADGGVTEYEYDSEGRMTRIKHPMGGVETAKYDAVGNLIERQAPDGGLFQIAYDVLDRPVAIADPMNRMRRAAYDKLGNVTAVTYEDGTEERFTYDLMGNQLSHTAPDGYTRFFRYNALNKLTEIRDADGVLTEFTYGPGGQLLQERSADGSSLEYAYDAAGNVIQVVDSVRGTWRFQYDCMGRVSAAEHVGEGTERYEYDFAGNLTAVTDGNGSRTAYQYSKAGALEKVTDACGTETAYRYDPCYRLVQILRPESGRLGAEQVNRFNQEQRVRVTSYERDLDGNVTAVEDSEGYRTEYSYDPCGRILSKLDPEGNLTTCTYRQDGTENVLTFGDGRTVKYQYDALKRLSQIEDWLGITRFARDAAGRITEVVDHEENRTGYTWNGRGLCTGLRYPDGRAASYEYDEGMRLSRLVTESADVRYAYQDNGQLRERIYPDGLRMGYEYDAIGRLTSLTRWDGAREVDRFTYAYDACARKTRITERHGDAPETDFRFGYDALGRLTSVMRDGQPEQAFEYDIFGNRSRMVRGGQVTTYGYDSLDRMLWSRTGDEERTFSYDRRGNLTGASVNGVRRLSLHFDALDRLAKASSDRGEAEYTYNGMALLAGAAYTQNGRSWQEKMMFDYSGEQNRLLASARDGLWEDFIWDKQPVLAVSASGSSFYLNDERMSNRGILTRDGYQEYSYDLFGIASQDAPAPGQFAYTGYRMDPVTGFYNAGWRQYDAAAGRFISRDPVAGTLMEPMSLNPFVYCMSDPINSVDPTGMILAWLAGGIVGTVVNVGSKLAGDIVNSVKKGKLSFSSWESYVGSAAGGFVQGSLYVVAGPYGSTVGGAAGAAVETFITNGLSMAFGEEGYRKEDGYNAGKLLWDTGVSTAKGAATGFVFGKAGEAITKYVKIPGITTGRGSYAAVWKQVMTKARNGQIANVTLKTLMKGLASFGVVKTIDSILTKGVDALKDSVKEYVKGKIGDILSWMLGGGSVASLPAGLRELLVPNRSATCATT